MTSSTSRGRVSFVGAGPGAGDLITVRGARRLAEADVILWAASVVAPDCLNEHASPEADLVDSSRLGHDEVLEVFQRAERDRLRVVRVHAGDPTLWGGLQAQYDECARRDVEVEIVPGVAELSAAAAAVGRELTSPDHADSVVLCRPEVSASEQVRAFAAHGTTMSVLLSASRAAQLVADLRAGGYPDDVPVLVASKVSSPDEVVLRTTVGELEQAVRQQKLWRQALFVVGRAVSGTRTRAVPARRAPARGADLTSRRAVRDPHPSIPNRHVTSPGHSERRPTWARASEASTAEAERAPATGTPNPDVAWWTVRNWQETARGAARTARASRRQEHAARSAQPHLFVQKPGRSVADEDAMSETAPEPENSRDATGDATTAPESTEYATVPERLVPESPAQQAAEDAAERQAPERLAVAPQAPEQQATEPHTAEQQATEPHTAEQQAAAFPEQQTSERGAEPQREAVVPTQSTAEPDLSEQEPNAENPTGPNASTTTPKTTAPQTGTTKTGTTKTTSPKNGAPKTGTAKAKQAKGTGSRTAKTGKRATPRKTSAERERSD